jgi:hypothetical protein
MSWVHYNMGVYEPYWPVSSPSHALIMVEANLCIGDDEYNYSNKI